VLSAIAVAALLARAKYADFWVPHTLEVQQGAQGPTDQCNVTDGRKPIQLDRWGASTLSPLGGRTPLGEQHG